MADQNALILIDQGVLPLLFGNLSTSYPPLLEQTLKCLAEFAFHYPECVAKAPTPRIISSISSLLLSSNDDVAGQAAIFLGNLSDDTIERKQMVINGGVLCHLKILLEEKNSKNMIHICNIFSNLADGNQAQKQDLINAELIGPVIPLIKSSNVEVAKCATRAIASLVNECSLQQKLQALPPICSSLAHKEAEIIRSALTCLTKVLENGGNDIETLCQRIRECNGLQQIQRLQIHDDASIKRLAEALLPYFDIKPPPRPIIELNFERPTR